MVNFYFNLASTSGIVFVVAGAALYAIRSWRPQLSRDHDIFFSAVGLLCGLVLVFYGWKYDPVMQFAQVLLTGATIFFAVENVRLRGVATEQAKREAPPIVDDERTVSRVYRAELDELDAYEERPATRRIRGTRDTRSTYADDYADEQEPPRRPLNRSSSSGTVDLSEPSDRPRKRRPRPDDRAPEPPEGRTVARESSSGSRRRPTNGSGRSETRPTDAPPRSRRSRPSTNYPNTYPSSYRSSGDVDMGTDLSSEDYVDYKPVNNFDEEDNSSQFDR
jgi:hypothetical protein